MTIRIDPTPELSMYACVSVLFDRSYIFWTAPFFHSFVVFFFSLYVQCDNFDSVVFIVETKHASNSSNCRAKIDGVWKWRVIVVCKRCFCTAASFQFSKM